LGIPYSQPYPGARPPLKPFDFGRGQTVIHVETGREMKVLHVTRYGDGIGPLYQCRWGDRFHWTSQAFGPEELTRPT
jgi:uncharacterized protein YodC (DUF2158 family)